MFRSSVFNNALSPSSPKDSQNSTEWCCSVMKRCLLLVVFAKIVPEFNWSALDLNNVFLVCTSAVGLSALSGVLLSQDSNVNITSLHFLSHTVKCRAVEAPWKADIEIEPFSEFAIGRRKSVGILGLKVSRGAVTMRCNDRDHFTVKGVKKI